MQGLQDSEASFEGSEEVFIRHRSTLRSGVSWTVTEARLEAVSTGWARSGGNSTQIPLSKAGRGAQVSAFNHRVSPRPFPFRAYDNVLKDAVAVKSQALAMVPGTSSGPTQMLFQPPAYPALGQPTPVALAQFQTPVQDLCLAYRDSLQAHCSGTLLSGGTSSSLHSSYPSLQPLDVCPVPLPMSLSMQMAVAAEPRHCLTTAYRGSYFSGSHVFPTGCFDR